MVQFDFEPHVGWTPAARKKLLPRPGTGSKPLNVDGAGISFAIEALANVNSRHWFASGRGKVAARILTPAQLGINQEQVDEEAWRVVRQFLAGADDATHAAALSTARKLWPTALVGT